MQALAAKQIMRLARGIETFFGAVAGGQMLIGGSHLAARSKRADKNLLGIRDLRFERRFYRRGRAVGGGVLEFLPQYGGIDVELLRDLVLQFVAHNAAGHALNVRQKIVDGFDFALGAASSELGAGSLDQVREIWL